MSSPLDILWYENLHRTQPGAHFRSFAEPPMSPNAATKTQRLAASLSLRNDVRYTAILLPYSHRNICLPGQMPLSSFF